MLNLRPAIMFGLVLALLVTTAAAGSGRKHIPPPTCDDCTNKVNNCRKLCLNESDSSCQFMCECNVGKSNKFCRDSCDMAGPESACEYF